MKIAVPSAGAGGLDDLIGEHFGRVPTYTIVDSDLSQVDILDNTSEHMGGSGYPPEILAKAGVTVLLCTGLGRRALEMLSRENINVYCGAKGTVSQALQDWKEGRLEPASTGNACDHGH